MSEEESKWGIDLEVVNCPKCNEKMPAIRIPKDIQQLMWGGWTCPNCDCKMDKHGKRIAD